ncbi:MAG: sodium ion-translocating decarboxylase subunit beta [Clostridiales bacterium]|nr:sodium ion-translocating decarboxylase subunit beta [Clostridiales bacterium]
METLNIGDSLVKLAEMSGVMQLIQDPKTLIMLIISCVLLYLAIVKKYEPLLLLPIAFGMLLVNLPLSGVMDNPSYIYLTDAFHNGKNGTAVLLADGSLVYQYLENPGGVLYYLYQGVKLGIFPPLIFLGVGCMTDFGPLIANPKSLLLGAAAQIGIFVTFIVCYSVFGFTAQEAASTGIIGGADGPTAIFLTGKLAPHLLGPIAVAAYSYMALVPVIQPPIMRALTTKKEREIVMEQLRPVTKTEKIIFPIAVTIIVSLLLPSAAPLIGMLMLGNLFRESGVVDRLNKTSQNELMNIVTIFLGVTVGATADAETFLQPKTLIIMCVGVVAFGFGTAGGVLLAKLMNKISGGKINPLIGSAGVSAVPMAARVSQVEGQKANPSNFLLMHAMGPNVAGVIGSAIAAGMLLSMFG